MQSSTNKTYNLKLPIGSLRSQLLPYKKQNILLPRWSLPALENSSDATESISDAPENTSGAP